MSWETKKLGDICEFVYGKGLPKRDRINGPYPVFGSGGIVNYHKSYLLEGPGIVVGRKGTIGSIYYSKENFWPIDTVFYIKPDDERYELRFLYYFLKTLDLDQLNTDAAVPGLNRNVAYSKEIKFPSIPAQRKIASILSAYDDLIENNTHRIKILEEMAQAIYKEWFANFKFPGYEKVKFVDSELGKIPEGWEVRKINELVDTQYGYTASSTTENIGPKFLRITDIVPNIIDWEAVPFCELEPEKISKYKLEFGDIIVARTGATVGYAKRINKLHPESVFASYLVRLKSNDINDNIIIGLACESDEYKSFIKANISGAAQPQANASVLSSYKINYPTKDIRNKFNDIVEPILDYKEKLQFGNTNLRKTRDLLLPKLMSGEIDVEEMDIEINEEKLLCYNHLPRKILMH